MSRAVSAILALACLLAALISSSSASNLYHIDLGSHQKQCYFDYLNKGDRFDMSFQVSSGGDMLIDFWILTPSSQMLHKITQESNSNFGFDAIEEGHYSYCFLNSMSGAVKSMSFISVGPDERKLFKEREYESSGGNTEHMRDIYNLIRALSSNIHDIKDGQTLNRESLVNHKATSESINSRVAWWSVAQALFVIVASAIQIGYLTRFFEVKRLA
ncbi:emp24/gp25L/p24 family/GOLD-domain-containing protein [Polychytrium aggregatum]|uniref:emp24/gp25L/p24 family/GOLD-domain-containing protein n=1 Tax=Polychytrium aggregatum TaxID=110093 RepID=UPI0022FEB2B0|nr:emp24/gp25L/p24 family/GOLD-domain-containing protein [Polychytrium aggregatum]KAI9205361.1 emp24/gp25L/p24 family/GOLD-domain-containing protein [Polychytrium aggregatum]